MKRGKVEVKKILSLRVKNGKQFSSRYKPKRNIRARVLEIYN